jgi:hypothetical protein
VIWQAHGVFQELVMVQVVEAIVISVYCYQLTKGQLFTIWFMVLQDVVT